MHKLTIDFEEWFHPFQLRSAISIPDWKLDISRIKYQTKILFEILDLTKTKATFFVVGWIADYFPEIIEQIKADGHEIGFHSYWHNPIFNLDEEAFKLDTEKAINSIYSITKTDIEIFRAPNFSIRKDTLWSLPILKEFGIKYDSSYHFTFFHPEYGKQFKFDLDEFENNNIKEFPISVKNILGINLPFAGGAYFRYYPIEFTLKLFKSFENENENIIFYIHPWELDCNLPKVNISEIMNLRMRLNIKKNRLKLETLLSSFQFEPINPLI